MSSDEAVEFDGIVDRVCFAAAEVAADDATVRIRREGTFGVLPAEIATPLVMVLNELLVNAVEHGFDEGGGGEVLVSVQRQGRDLYVRVTDTGKGLPDDFELDTSERLGLQIVRTLVAGELRGTIVIHPGRPVGTQAELVVPLAKR
jgi:two-component sensor histidine kinase